MLSELMLAGVTTDRPAFKPGSTSGLYVSGLHPCAYRMYKMHKGEVYAQKEEPQSILNMEDGHFQETQAMERLKNYAKIEVKDNQRRVTIGKAETSGRIDGTFTFSSKEYLWEFKAMNENRYRRFTASGLDTFLDYRSQYNGYLLGLGLEECVFQAKHKDSNSYHDITVKLDRPFIEEIVKLVDRIKLESWVPEPDLCSYCAYCGLGCFGEVLDLSRFGVDIDEEDLTDKWQKAKQYLAVGQMLEDEVRHHLVGVKDKFGTFIQKGLIGDKDSLLIGGLQVKKVMIHRIQPSKNLIMQMFGPEVLMKVSEESDTATYRISERRR